MIPITFMNDHPKTNKPPVSEAFVKLIQIVHRLRAPGGCPWDRKQTPESLKQYIVEEAYEVIDAIDAKEDPELCEELGDLLLQVALQADIAAEKGTFDIVDVCRGISQKLIRRHPHVFGDVEVDGADEVISNWEQIKQKEKKGRGLFDGLPAHLPALQTAGRMGEKAARVGFDWPDVAGVRAKVIEELREVEEAAASGDNEALESEIGDLLFSVAQWSRHLGIEPEEALRGSCGRFKKRFSLMEEMAIENQKVLSDMGMDDLEALWQTAKGRSGGER
jgi:tetrapyrrole methylase family protein / MazG family protein